MEKRLWLRVSENALLVGSGIGSLAAVVFQQLAYAATPMTLFLVLNLVNRRRFEQHSESSITDNLVYLDQRVASEIGTVRQQIETLPSYADLKALEQAVLGRQQADITHLQKQTAQQFASFEEHKVKAVQKDLNHIKEQFFQLSASLNDVTTYLHRLATSSRVEGLEKTISSLKTEVAQAQTRLQGIIQEPKPDFQKIQEQISHLNRRFNSLPAPFDANALKQDVESLVKLVGELVTRREIGGVHQDVGKLKGRYEELWQSLSGVTTYLQYLQRLVPSTRVANLEKEIAQMRDAVAQSPSQVSFEDIFSESQPGLEAIQEQIHQLNQRLNSLSTASDTPRFEQEVASLTKRVGELAPREELSQLAAEVAQIRGNQKTLQQSGEPTSLEGVQFRERLEDLTQKVNAQGEMLAKQTDNFSSANSLVLKLQKPSNLDPSQASEQRSTLETVLGQVQKELIIVWPWLSPDNFNDALIQKFRQLLDRKGSIEMGLGHLGDVNQGRVPKLIDPQWIQGSGRSKFLCKSLSYLTQLKRDYPKQFKFKVLGTDENFLICDRTFAILGVHHLTTTSTVFPTLEVGLRTTDPEIIQGLMARFKNPTIDAQNAAAYFNRGATRAELGDKQGAIADYTQVIQIRPQDDIAYNNRGLIRYELGDKLKASVDLDQAIQFNPHNAVAYCNRGILSADVDDKLAAIEDYSRAIQIDPNCANAYFHRGLARTRLGNKQGAVTDYTEVIRIHPQSALAYFYRGLAYAKLGRKQEALGDLQTSAQLFTTEGDQVNAQKALSMLNKLQKTSATVSVIHPVPRHGT